MDYRNLTVEEIAILESRGCSSPDWSAIDVASGFNPDGIRNARIVDCFIGNDVRISNVFGELRNLHISDGTSIEAVYSISYNKEEMERGVYRMEVMSETGGRPVVLSPSLTGQLAYLQAFYRHNALFSKKLEELAMRDARPEASARGMVGEGARIANCGAIHNVFLGKGCQLFGVSRLRSGRVGKAEIGPDVIARDFIVSDGATVSDGAHIKGVFVGEGAIVAGATVHDSLIFANSSIENGEVAASFLGAFSTSMHKSTLLIGGLFSFFNAGSGSNQSNHAYKLGPMHQGITQRGCKTGSDSYILWPAAIGAFTTILGRHYSHPDTRDFPFSILLNDKEGGSMLLPGAAAATVGFARDVDKWPKRDGRESDYDIIDFHWLSPFTVEGCLRGLKCLEEGQTPVGVTISEKAAKKGKRLYKLLIDRYVAETFLTKIQASISVSPQYGVEEILETLRAGAEECGSAHWVDLAGMLAPKSEIEEVMKTVVDDGYKSLRDVQKALADVARSYPKLNWRWTIGRLEELTGIPAAQLTAENVAAILERGAQAVEEMTAIWEADAAKEFDPERASLGFGIDAYENQQEILDDFARSRGSLAGNKFLALNQRTTKDKASRMRMFAQVMRQSK